MRRPVLRRGRGFAFTALAALVASGTVAASVAATAATAAAAPAQSPATSSLAGAHQTKVTLITGDVVTVARLGQGQFRVVNVSSRSGVTTNASVMQLGRHLYVVPQSATALLSRHKVDTALFDVAGLVRDGYDDQHRSTLPFIVDYGKGRPAAAEARSASIATTRRTVTISSIGAAAYVTPKRSAGTTWASLTTGPAAAPTGLADGATKVWLDGKVKGLAVQPNLTQIHVPQAWSSGYTGQGVKVAVLDGGYDPTHPDLQGKVSLTQSFTPDGSVVDTYGHGTHVASTIVGAGEAGGPAEGVAPGAKLMIGRVIGDDNFGDDSWVLAGMQWAVNNGADIVSMSLGSGDSDDGTAPLSQAVNELSASSGALFVLAAGNTGADASTINAAGSADAALTVGAVDNNDQVAYFSSRGPRLNNGAIKPDVTAPGVGIVAARAAGTAMGNPVDDYYTAADGTSMATPQVSGIAALVKQKHPAWTGQQIKDAIVGSTDAISNATVYDTGSGRVDAESALNATVLADPSLNLGYFRWPYSALAPQTTPLTYSNTTGTAVTLDLTLGAEDPSGTPAPGVSLGASSVRVPAHGTASVDVTLDPTVPKPGSYGAVVTATPRTTGSSIRTAVGFTLEPERYDLTVHVIPRNGVVSSQHILGLLNADASFTDFRQLDSAPGTQTYTLRVPRGTYTLSDIASGVTADGSSQGWLAFQPSVTVNANTTVNLDGRVAKRYTYSTQRPVVDSGLNLFVQYSFGGGPVQVQLTGVYDQVFAPGMSSTISRDVSYWTYWLLSQPEAQVTLPSGSAVALRPVARPGRLVDDVRTPRLTGSYRVVDGGSTSAPQLSGVRGSVVLLSSPCGDLAAAAAQAKAKGAKAVIGYPTGGCAPNANVQPMPTLSHRVGIPVLQVRPDGAAQLLAVDGLKVAFRTHGYPSYLYDLMDTGADGLPAGRVTDGSDAKLHALVQHFRSAGPSRGHGYRMSEIMVPFTATFPTAAPYGIVHRLPIPVTVTRYVSADAKWQREVTVSDAKNYNNPLATAFAFQTPYAAGERSSETWFGGPMTSWVSPEQARLEPLAQPNRAHSKNGDVLNMPYPPLEDADGHLLQPVPFSNDIFIPSLWVDGKRYQDFWDVPLINQTQHVKYGVQFGRSNGFWARSTRTNTVWEFDTKHSTKKVAALPLMTVNYGMQLDARNFAPKSRAYTFTVRFGMPMRVTPAATHTHTLTISWDHGKTWKPVAMTCRDVNAVDGGTDTLCTVSVHNHAKGTASLRVYGKDALGRSIRQTTIDAYAVH